MLMHDLRYAFRVLAKKPGVTTLTILVMAAGLGLSTYLFSFLNTVAYQDLSFKDSETLMGIAASRNGVREGGSINFHDYHEIRNNLKGMKEFTSYYHIDVNVSGRDGARRYSGVAVEPNFFQITRTNPLLGRDFNSYDNLVGEKKVVVISYEVWQTQFNGNENILSEMLRINGENYQVIGVMPNGYLFPEVAKLWLPMRQDVKYLARGRAAKVKGFAHIKSGFSLQSINDELNLIMRRLEARYPTTNKGIGAHIDTPLMVGAGHGASVLNSMTVVAFLILLLASINVGNLLLSRAFERSKETAIRIALGASYSRLICQLLLESIIICTIGGIIGLLLVDWALDITQLTTRTFFVDGPPFWFDFGINVFTIKLFLFLLTSSILLTGLIPAWKSVNGDFNAILRDGTRGALGFKAGKLNQLLVVSEIFISMSVMIAASVVVFGTYTITQADYGSNTDSILTAQVLLPNKKYNTKESKTNFINILQSQLESHVNIGDVMITTALPGVYTYRPGMEIKGHEYRDENEENIPKVNYVGVMPGTLGKLDVELIAGRYFDKADNGLDKKTAIVTDSFVSKYFPGQVVLGKQLRIVEHDDKNINWLTIIGVVEHTIQGEAVISGDIAKLPSVFQPLTQAPSSLVTIAIKMKLDRKMTTRVLRNVLTNLDSELPAFRIETYDELIARNKDPSIFITTIFLVFAVISAALASSGIYGVMSNIVNQNTHEIGVKRALGAMEQRITLDYIIKSVKQLMWGGIPGLLVGCTMGLAMSKMMGIQYTILFMISFTITMLFSIIVLLAAYVPTRRALKMEPAVALHYE